MQLQREINEPRGQITIKIGQNVNLVNSQHNRSPHPQMQIVTQSHPTQLIRHSQQHQIIHSVAPVHYYQPAQPMISIHNHQVQPQMIVNRPQQIYHSGNISPSNQFRHAF